MAFNGRFVVNISQFASQHGVKQDELLSLSGKNIDELCKDDCIVENDIYNSIIEKAVKESKDNLFGLHAGENMNLAAAGLIAQITQNSESVKQALEYCCEFANLGCSVLPMSLNEMDGFYKVKLVADEKWKNSSPSAYRHTSDGVLAFSLREYLSLTQMQHYPLKINLPWEEDESRSEYERVFNCKVAFNSTDLSMELSKAQVEEKILTSDYDLLRILVAHAHEKTDKLKQDKGFVSLVQQSVINLVKPDFPTIEEVASHLNISSRTLQRRLNEEGSNYKELIDELRKEFAFSYLKRNELT